MTEQQHDTLTQSWAARDVLFLELFGPHVSSIPSSDIPPKVVMPDVKSAKDIAAISGQIITEKMIPVLTYEPNETRPYWMYATSGLSNQWFESDDNDVSGLGLELVVKTSSKARWPIRLLRRLSYYVLSYSGTLQPGVMLTLDAPLLAGRDSGLSSIIVWYADETPDCVYQLPTGAFGVFLVLGISDEESEFVRSTGKYGVWCMQQVLRNLGFGQLTNPDRQSVIQNPEARAMVSSLLNYAHQFADAEAKTQSDEEFWVD